ncbi:MAG: transcription termination/antitermination protein NusG [Hyphomicrobiales bacterium]|nr:transcription termination/antitermination protein NusG [Hyphomicrobiales bacterium]
MAARWYIVHAHSGSEKKVAQSIRERAEQENMTQYIEDVCVPVEGVIEVKRGKKVSAERKFFPGYVLVKMDLNDATWHLVKNTPKVTGFLGGSGNRPQPISDREAEQIFRQIEEGLEAPKHGDTYEIGDQVRVVDGPFESFVGSVEGVDNEKHKLKVSVSIFGRATPVELEYLQVEKI